MSSEREDLLFKAHRDTQEKYCYFLLAASGAAIGFALSQTQNAKISWWQIPLGISVLFWGLSFIFGCLFIQYSTSIIYKNYELLRIERGMHPLTGSSVDSISVASEVIRKYISKDIDIGASKFRLQFIFLIGGAIIYIAWHVIAMYLRS